MMQHSYQRCRCSTSLLCLTSPAVRHVVSTLRIYSLPMRCVGMRFFSVRLVLTQGNKKKNPRVLVTDNDSEVHILQAYALKGGLLWSVNRNIDDAKIEAIFETTKCEKICNSLICKIFRFQVYAWYAVDVQMITKLKQVKVYLAFKFILLPLWQAKRTIQFL